MANRGNTVSEKIGPWRREDFDSFLALDVELRPPPPRNALLQLGPPPGLLADPESIASYFRVSNQDWRDQEQQRLIDEAWKVRRVHPVYKSLVKNSNFNAAWSLFETRRKTAAATDEKLASPTAPFVFLGEFVNFAGLAYRVRASSKSGRPASSKSGGYARDREAAINHANELNVLLGAGVSLKDYFDNQRLRELLQKLSDELSNTRRKKYGGKGAIERSLLKSFAFSMLLLCGLKSPKVLMRFADMVGLRCDEKKAKRYCDEAAKNLRDLEADRRRKALAEALMQQASPQAV